MKVPVYQYVSRRFAAACENGRLRTECYAKPSPTSSCCVTATMRMLAQEDENDDTAEVTWEDQQRINSFSKLNTRLRGIEEKMEGLKVVVPRPGRYIAME